MIRQTSAVSSARTRQGTEGPGSWRAGAVGVEVKAIDVTAIDVKAIEVKAMAPGTPRQTVLSWLCSAPSRGLAVVPPLSLFSGGMRTGEVTLSDASLVSVSCFMLRLITLLHPCTHPRTRAHGRRTGKAGEGGCRLRLYREHGRRIGAGAHCGPHARRCCDDASLQHEGCPPCP